MEGSPTLPRAPTTKLCRARRVEAKRPVIDEMDCATSQWLDGSLLAFLVVATGWNMGSLEMTQALMTTQGGRFATSSSTQASAFLVSFGISKAASNLLAGRLADWAGRRPTMVLGWIAGAAVPPLLFLAQSWGIVVASDLLLGVNQAFCWSCAIFGLLDLLGPSRRALAVGIAETLGYAAIAASRPILTSTGGCSAETRERPAGASCGVAKAAPLPE